MQEPKETTLVTEPSSLKRWDIQDINWSCYSPHQISANLVHIITTTCLVESRADLYSSYLLSVFHSQIEWHQKIRIWHQEESQHGQVLRKWAELANPNFNFENSYREYIRDVPYHSLDMHSVRGSIEHELLTRCVVEALASGYYAAIRDSTAEPLLCEVCHRLSKDEARHYGMFYKFFKETQKVESITFLQKLTTIVKRVLELEDNQIIYASYSIKNYSDETPYLERREVTNYLSMIYPLYKQKHLYYVLSFIFPLLGFKEHRWFHHLISWSLYFLLQARIFVMKIFR